MLLKYSENHILKPYTRTNRTKQRQINTWTSLVLHVLDSLARPSLLQSLPPFWGLGLVHERERC